MAVNLNKVLEKIDGNALAIVLVIFAVSSRFLPHPPNFAAVGAVALFSGVYLTKKHALWLPLFVMAVSDIFIGFHNLIFFTWGSFVLIGVVGLWLRSRKNIQNVVFATLTGSLLFFFITNSAVWVFTPMYGKNIQGLLECFVMALPFFRNTLAGDIFFVGVLFGAYEGVKYLLPKIKENTVIINFFNK